MPRAHGGSRPGAGGTVSVIKISKAHAKALRLLLRSRLGGAYGQAEVERWVEAQIDRAVAETQQAEDQVWNGKPGPERVVAPRPTRPGRQS
jgi:hypothetical protein